jgi:acetyltransferase-like isoleucine patch superfamily enzyme
MSAEVFQHRYEGPGTVTIQPMAMVGFEYREGAKPVRFDGDSMVRSHTVIYGDVAIGDHFQAGHSALIREHTTIGQHVMVGSHVVVDGHVTIGDFVKIQTACYIPTHTTIGSRVFLGPHAVLTNDRFPLKQRDSYEPQGPHLEDGVTLGAGSVVLPGVRVGAHSFVAAGAVVTKDVPPHSLVMGNPGRVSPLPDHLREPNRAKNWPSALLEDVD